MRTRRSLFQLIRNTEDFREIDPPLSRLLAKLNLWITGRCEDDDLVQAFGEMLSIDHVPEETTAAPYADVIWERYLETFGLP